VINSKAARYYFDAMITDGLSVAPDQVRQLPIPRAASGLQKEIASRVANLIRLRKEHREELRRAAFRHIVAARTRVGEDDLGHYMNRLGESDLAVGGRLDGVSQAKHASLLPEIRGDELILQVRYQKGPEAREERGEVICRFERSVNRFLALTLLDREKPTIGSGRLMAKVRAVEVPRFDAEWDRHLEIVREVGATVERHEKRANAIGVEIAADERKIDDAVYGLFGLASSEIAK